ncbi:hypothetical protein Terro_0449 [Terriglobus roseus DSM 18391]|uniref:Uncharacterized protein n=1 Tax=Terriglobus roseus (strain DSM 18391 / NRRL B-41598 / KBS 63) TaxID=926566 RepID=I3ZC24_TERRK|nr:hypothetical protein [Terriglobus roseus]AFL86792.1 hypothetical protein Terro_0449 [Terriglobus roseus DSM 18391]
MLPICRHILTNGEQCRSLRLTGQDFCYFHNRMHASHKATRESQPDRPLYNTEGEVVGYSRPAGFQPARIPDLGLLEDRTAVQVAISTVVNALASDAMDIRRATALLYGLQLASNNCPPIRRDHSQAKDPVESTVTAENGTIMAPADRVPPAVQANGDWLKQMQELFDAEDAEEADDEDY